MTEEQMSRASRAFSRPMKPAGGVTHPATITAPVDIKPTHASEQPAPEIKRAPIVAEPISRETVSIGSALHKSWEDLQTGAAFEKKNSDKQFLEKKMAERYQIFRRVAGDRHAAKRVDYR